jgi:transposase
LLPILRFCLKTSRRAGTALREVFNGLRFVVKCGAPWRWMPHDLPPWAIVYQHWLATCFLRLVRGYKGLPEGGFTSSS